MLKLVVCNQKGGMSKTTTTLCIARCMADRGMRVLVIDADSQGNIATSLGINFKNSLYHFLIHDYRLQDCVQPVHPKINVLCSTRQTVEAEGILTAQLGREMIFRTKLRAVDDQYDAILFDTSPSITLLTSCAMMYAQQVLIPLIHDPLALAGAYAAISGVDSLNELFSANVKAVAFLPVMVDQRLAMTEVIQKSIDMLATKHSVKILHSIRIDAEVKKATGAQQLLADFNPKSKALADYSMATDQLLTLLRDQVEGKYQLSLTTSN